VTTVFPACLQNRSGTKDVQFRSDFELGHMDPFAQASNSAPKDFTCDHHDGANPLAQKTAPPETKKN